MVVCDGRPGSESWADGGRPSEEGCAVDVRALYQSGVVMGGAVTEAGSCETDFDMNLIAAGFKPWLGNSLKFRLVGDIFLSATAELPAFPEILSSPARK